MILPDDKCTGIDESSKYAGSDSKLFKTFQTPNGAQDMILSKFTVKTVDRNAEVTGQVAQDRV